MTNCIFAIKGEINVNITPFCVIYDIHVMLILNQCKNYTNFGYHVCKFAEKHVFLGLQAKSAESEMNNCDIINSKYVAHDQT